jgi:hypothetical protein
MAQDLQVDLNELNGLMASGPVVIWLPMRLGINELNPVYKDLVKQLLSSKLTIGLGGGRPKSSYYFFGYAGTYIAVNLSLTNYWVDDDLLYLDPHVTRTSVKELDAQALGTYRGESPKRMPINAIDPCFVAGFLLKDKSDLNQFMQDAALLVDPQGHPMIAFNEGSIIADIQMDEIDGDSDFVDIT